MQVKNIFRLACLVIIFSVFGNSQEPDFNKIRLTHLSERAIVMSGTQFKTNQLILKSKIGLILIDSGISPQYAKKIRSIASTEFNIDNFIYIINTHHHWDHVQGNQVFPEATIVGHENCGDQMRSQKPVNIKTEVNQIRIKENQKNTALDKIPPPPPSHILIDGVGDFSLTPPDLSFRDRLKIVSGDLTLYLLWYGECHTNNDILIYCPEENILAVGDLFYKKSLPPFSKHRDLNIPQWIKTLDWILGEEHLIKYIVPGHNELLERGDLVLYRNYIATLWKGIKKAISKGYSLQKINHNFSLKNKFPALVNRDHFSNNGGSLHQGNVNAIWNQILKNEN